MGTKAYLNAILPAIFLFTVFFTCRKRVDCKQNIYSFKVGITAKPGTDSIALNDTLWFIINESTRLQDLNLSKQVEFKNAANLSFVFGIHKVLGPQTITPSAASFEYVVRKGQSIPPIAPDLLKEFRLSEESDRYLLEVGFIAKEKGVFRVLTEHAANVYTKNNPCDKASFSVHYPNTEQHIYLGYNLWGEGVYYFKVY